MLRIYLELKKRELVLIQSSYKLRVWVCIYLYSNEEGSDIKYVGRCNYRNYGEKNNKSMKWRIKKEVIKWKW